MFLAIAIVVGILGHLSSGIPLESPSSDFSQFFGQRIVGGSEAAEGKAPYMAALVVGFTWQSLVCGASIIGSQRFITAAHCVMLNWEGGLLDTFHAIVGTNTWHKGTVVEFKSHRIHPYYDHWYIKNDIAVLCAKKKIEFNERVAVIALKYGRLGGGVRCFVTGWGTQSLWGIIPNELQILQVTTISYKQCQKAVTQAAIGVGWRVPHVDYSTEVCTLHSYGHGMCHGDSGSPLVEKRTGKQLGVVSWGARPCAVAYPDVYATLNGPGTRELIENATMCGC